MTSRRQALNRRQTGETAPHPINRLRPVGMIIFLFDRRTRFGRQTKIEHSELPCLCNINSGANQKHILNNSQNFRSEYVRIMAIFRQTVRLYSLAQRAINGQYSDKCIKNASININSLTIESERRTTIVMKLYYRRRTEILCTKSCFTNYTSKTVVLHRLCMPAHYPQSKIRGIFQGQIVLASLIGSTLTSHERHLQHLQIKTSTPVWRKTQHNALCRYTSNTRNKHSPYPGHKPTLPYPIRTEGTSDCPYCIFITFPITIYSLIDRQDGGLDYHFTKNTADLVSLFGGRHHQ